MNNNQYIVIIASIFFKEINFTDKANNPLWQLPSDPLPFFPTSTSTLSLLCVPQLYFHTSTYICMPL